MHWGRYLFSLYGRTSRAGYWLFILIALCVSIAGIMIDHVAGTYSAIESGPFEIIASLLTIPSSIAITVKRFHDREMSGYWIIGFALLTIGAIASLAFVPGEPFEFGEGMPPAFVFVGVLGAVVIQIIQLVILGFLPGTRGPNKYGPDPLADKE